MLASSPSTFIPKPRAISSLTSSSVRARPAARAVAFRPRWASSEAEARKDDEEVPISELQPTPQEEVENAIQEDNAGVEEPSPAQAAAEYTESTEEAGVPQAETSQADVFADPAPAASALPDRKAPVMNEPKATVYVGNLFFDVTENDVQTEFKRFGPIEKARIMRDSRGLSKG